MERRYACDACRRRRVKCDANQPCAQCARNGITCTYGSVTNRQSATSYARSLEQQVADLQRQLQTLADPGAGSPSQSSTEQAQSQHSQIDVLVSPGHDLVLQQVNGKKVYRYSAAFNVLRTVADMLSSGRTTSELGKSLVEVMETPRDLPARASLDWLDALLPSKEQIWDKICHAIDVALVGHDCISKAAFRARLDTVLDQPGQRSKPEHLSFLALVYALLALGELFESSLDDSQPADGGQSNKLHGLNYFRASRYILHDEHEHADLDSVLAVMLHARYLDCTTAFSDAHAALSTAISTAMHMGLHLDDTYLQDSFSPSELYDRRRVFAVLNMMETYFVFPLGIPRTLRPANSKQTLGLTEDDLLDSGASLIARDATTPEAEAVLNQKLVKVYAKIVDRQFECWEEFYHEKDWVSNVEVELKHWEEQLPKLSQNFPSRRVLHGQLYLRLHWTAAHMLLYAPCLHHLGRDRSDPAWNVTGYDYGSKCVHAASQTVFLMKTLEAHSLLSPVLWMNSYVLTWAAVVLAYFVICSRTRVTIVESRRAALLANEMLQKLGATNGAAHRIHECIAPYMDILATASEE